MQPTSASVARARTEPSRRGRSAGVGSSPAQGLVRVPRLWVAGALLGLASTGCAAPAVYSSVGSDAITESGDFDAETCTVGAGEVAIPLSAGNCVAPSKWDYLYGVEGDAEGSYFTYAEASEDTSVSFSFGFREKGTYAVDVYIADLPERVRQAEYRVAHHDRLEGETRYLNQDGATGWASLGEFRFDDNGSADEDGGSSYSLTVSDRTTDLERASDGHPRRVVVGPIRFRRVAPFVSSCEGAADAAACCQELSADSCAFPCAFDACAQACSATGTAGTSTCGSDRLACPAIGEGSVVLDAEGACFEWQQIGCKSDSWGTARDCSLAADAYAAYDLTPNSSQAAAPGRALGAGAGNLPMTVDGMDERGFLRVPARGASGRSTYARYSLPGYYKETQEAHGIGIWNLHVATPGRYRIEVHMPDAAAAQSLPHAAYRGLDFSSHESHFADAEYELVTRSWLDGMPGRNRSGDRVTGEYVDHAIPGWQVVLDEAWGVSCLPAEDYALTVQDILDGSSRLPHYGGGHVLFFDAIRVTRVGDC